MVRVRGRVTGRCAQHSSRQTLAPLVEESICGPALGADAELPIPDWHGARFRDQSPRLGPTIRSLEWDTVGRVRALQVVGDLEGGCTRYRQVSI